MPTAESPVSIPTKSFLPIRENGCRMAQSIISHRSFIGRPPGRARAFPFFLIGGRTKTFVTATFGPASRHIESARPRHLLLTRSLRRSLRHVHPPKLQVRFFSVKSH